jgi:hypothetical protein
MDMVDESEQDGKKGKKGKKGNNNLMEDQITFMVDTPISGDT